MSSDTLSINISIKLTCDSTVFGNSIYMVGNVNELGNWEVDKALLLCGDTFPIWKGSFSLQLENKKTFDLECYFIKKLCETKNANESYQYEKEPAQNNHVFVISVDNGDLSLVSLSVKWGYVELDRCQYHYGKKNINYVRLNTFESKLQKKNVDEDAEKCRFQLHDKGLYPVYAKNSKETLESFFSISNTESQDCIDTWTVSSDCNNDKIVEIPSWFGIISDQYYYLATIAYGSTSEVGLVRSKRDKEIFVSKHVPKYLVPDVNSCLTEVKLLTELKSPGIVHMCNYYDTLEDLVIILKYCEGGDLYQQILDNPVVDEYWISHMIRQILHIVKRCHEQNIVHCDLKLQNFMIKHPNPWSQLILIDFGLAKKIVNNQDIVGTFGTTQYMAPEVVEGHFKYEADVWSIGIIMFMMLSKKVPYRNSLTLDAGKNELIKINNVPDYISDDAKDLLSRLLERNRHKRISIADALKHRFISNNRISEFICKSNEPVTVIAMVWMLRKYYNSTLLLQLLTAILLIVNFDYYYDLYKLLSEQFFSGEDSLISNQKLVKIISESGCHNISYCLEVLKIDSEFLQKSAFHVLDFTAAYSATVMQFPDDQILNIYNALSVNGSVSIDCQQLKAKTNDLFSTCKLKNVESTQAAEILKKISSNIIGNSLLLEDLFMILRPTLPIKIF